MTSFLSYISESLNRHFARQMAPDGAVADYHTAPAAPHITSHFLQIHAALKKFGTRLNRRFSEQMAPASTMMHHSQQPGISDLNTEQQTAIKNFASGLESHLTGQLSPGGSTTHSDIIPPKEARVLGQKEKTLAKSVANKTVLTAISNPLMIVSVQLQANTEQRAVDVFRKIYHGPADDVTYKKGVHQFFRGLPANTVRFGLVEAGGVAIQGTVPTLVSSYTDSQFATSAAIVSSMALYKSTVHNFFGMISTHQAEANVSAKDVICQMTAKKLKQSWSGHFISGVATWSSYEGIRQVSESALRSYNSNPTTAERYTCYGISGIVFNFIATPLAKLTIDQQKKDSMPLRAIGAKYKETYKKNGGKILLKQMERSFVVRSLPIVLGHMLTRAAVDNYNSNFQQKEQQRRASQPHLAI